AGRLDGLRMQAFGERRREYNVEYRIVLPGRGVRWIESRSLISYDGDGKAQRVIGVNIDVTDRKRTEVALQASEAKFAGILAIAGDAILSIDAQHRITLFNEAAEKVYGYSQAEALGQPIDLLIDCLGSEPDIARRVGDRQEVIGLRKNGEEFPAEVSISKLVGVGGQRYYTVVMRDISDRKRAEQALAERNAQLDLAHRTARVGCYSYDISSKTMRLSRASAASQGLSGSTIVLTSEQFFARVHRDEVQRVREEYDR